MAWTLGEHAVDSILAALQAGMEAKIVELNTTYSTSVENGDVLEGVAMWFTGEQELARIHKTPALFVFADSVEFDTPRSTRTMEPEVDIRIGILVEDIDPSRLRDRVYRYGRAILEVLFDAKRADTLGGWQFRERARIEYSPTLARSSSFLGDAMLSWKFTKQEDR